MNRPALYLIAFSCIAIAFSVVYYFVLFLPANTSAQQLLRHQTDCRASEDAIKKSEGKAKPKDILTFSNHFNQRLNRCYVMEDDVSFSDLDAGITHDETTIIDVAEDKTVLTCVVNRGTLSDGRPVEDTLKCFDEDGNTISEPDVQRTEDKFMSN